MLLNTTENQLVERSEQIAKVLDGNCKHKNLCPVKDIMACFTDKWSMYTVLILGQKSVMRFNELKWCIKGISQRMLTVTLRSLEEDGIVLRTVYPEIPPHVEYELTPLGKSLAAELLRLASWADNNFNEIIKSRKKYQRKTS